MIGKERVNDTGEVFTPRSLIREMLDRLPNSVWFDPNKTWLEPAAGDGNFLVEIKARLLQAGHSEVHILENMLFSVELIDDNHWVLQHRLGYLIEGQPNPALNPDNFTISKIHPLTQDLNDQNPYITIGCERDEVLHHRNHVCWTALEYDMSFGRTEDVITDLPLLPVKGLGPWPETDTPDIGEKYVVEKMLGKQPQLAPQEPPVLKSLAKDGKNPTKPLPVPKPKVEKPPKLDAKGGGWQVKAEWIGKGLKIRCKSPVDGSFWECDHDALVEAINASLKAKGKPLIGEPGPSEKSYGASSGLREQHLWSRV